MIAMIHRPGGKRMLAKVMAPVVAILVAITVSLPSAWASGVPNGWTMSPGGQVIQDTPMTGVSCPDISHCWAVGTDQFSTQPSQAVLLASTDAGTTWHTVTPPGLGQDSALESVACPDAAHCWVGGHGQSGAPIVYDTTNGGASWATQSIPGSSGDVSALSCPDDSHCWAIVAGQVIGTADAGQTWTGEPTPDSGDLVDLACPDDKHCFGVGSNETNGVIDATTDGGASWTRQFSGWANDHIAFQAVSCPSATTCLAVGDNPYGAENGKGQAATTDGGSSWQSVSLDLDNFDVRAVSCPDTHSCRFGGVGFMAGTHDFGAHISTDKLPSAPSATPVPFPHVAAMSCPSVFHCVAAGNDAETYPTNGVLLVTQGGGAFPGYWLVASDGGVFSFGSAHFVGSAAPYHPASGVVGMAPTPDGDGYWLATAAGGVYTFGDAGFYGAAAGRPLPAPIVDVASSRDGRGYWLVGADGSVYAFGDAPYEGSMAGHHLNAPVVGMAVTPSGAGYWLAAADKGVFTFGDATYFGGGPIIGPLNQPIVGIAAVPGQQGYWLVARDGGVFSFGFANFWGSTGATRLNQPIVGMVAPDGGGYWLVAADGGVFSFGDANFYGSTGSIRLARPVVGMS